MLCHVTEKPFSRIPAGEWVSFLLFENPREANGWLIQLSNTFPLKDTHWDGSLLTAEPELGTQTNQNVQEFCVWEPLFGYWCKNRKIPLTHAHASLWRSSWQWRSVKKLMSWWLTSGIDRTGFGRSSLGIVLNLTSTSKCCGRRQRLQSLYETLNSQIVDPTQSSWWFCTPSSVAMKAAQLEIWQADQITIDEWDFMSGDNLGTCMTSVQR